MTTENTSGVHKVYRRDNQPFAQIPNEAIRDARITANAFRLLAYLMSHRDGYELTYSQIERETGLGRYAINQAIDNLAGLGWLVTERTKLPNGQFGPKSWTVLNPNTSTSVGDSTVGDSTVEQPTDNKKNNNQEEHSKEKTFLQTSFEEFWQVFPRRQEKQAAFKALAKALHETSLETILEGARRYAADPNRTREFTKLPATWLNKGCWDDEPLPPRVLTPEQREAKALEEKQARWERERLEQEKRRAEMRAEEERLRRDRELNPVERCVHDRVKVMCPRCS